MKKRQLWFVCTSVRVNWFDWQKIAAAQDPIYAPSDSIDLLWPLVDGIKILYSQNSLEFGNNKWLLSKYIQGWSKESKHFDSIKRKQFVLMALNGTEPRYPKVGGNIEDSMTIWDWSTDS